jgi:hypothetical protein
MALGLVAMLGLASAPALAGGSGAQKAPLIHTDGTFVTCGSATSTTPTGNGFAVIGAHGNTLSAEVSLKNGPPDASYSVFLLQPGQFLTLCSNAVGTLTTNDHGNGNARVSEPLKSSPTGAFVTLGACSAGGVCPLTSTGPADYATPEVTVK